MGFRSKQNTVKQSLGRDFANHLISLLLNQVHILVYEFLSVFHFSLSGAKPSPKPVLSSRNGNHFNGTFPRNEQSPQIWAKSASLWVTFMKRCQQGQSFDARKNVLFFFSSFLKTDLNVGKTIQIHKATTFFNSLFFCGWKGFFVVFRG